VWCVSCVCTALLLGWNERERREEKKRGLRRERETDYRQRVLEADECCVLSFFSAALSHCLLSPSSVNSLTHLLPGTLAPSQSGCPFCAFTIIPIGNYSHHPKIAFIYLMFQLASFILELERTAYFTKFESICLYTNRIEQCIVVCGVDVE
jgi:hypothetical protein